MALVDVTDIVPEFKAVTVGKDQEIAVYGMGVEQACYLVNRFPELKAMLKPGTKVADFRVDKIFDAAPKAIGAICAAGANKFNDKKAEEVLAKLPMQYQLDIIEAIVDRSMPDGPGPFVEKVMAGMVYAQGFREGLNGQLDGAEPLATSEITLPTASNS